MKKNKTFVIIDGNAIIHRAYHAIPGLSTKDGTVVNAVYGFASMLIKVINDFQPDYMAVSFDVAGGTFRDEIYEDYKATRVKADQDLYDQIPLVHEVVEAFDIPIYTKEGYEADDVIGTVAEKVKKEDGKITTIIVTGDKDMLQLVDDRKTEVYLLRKGISEFELYDEDAVEKRFGFGPDLIVDYKALRGDSSDNIPGVKGVGEKTATTLIAELGDLEAIYKAVKKGDELPVRDSVVQKLIDEEDNAFMSYDLALIRDDLKGLKFKLEDCVMQDPEVEQLRGLFQKFEFVSLLGRLKHEGTPQKVKSKASSVVVKKVGPDKLKKLEAALVKHKTFFCREVLDGNDLFVSNIRGCVFVVDGQGWFVETSDLSKLQHIFGNNSYQLVGHDLKQLVKLLQLHEILLGNTLFDVMVGSYVLNSSTRAHDLRSIVLRDLGEDVAKSDQANLFGADPGVIAVEGEYILDVYHKQAKELEEENMTRLFETMEMPLIPVLAAMERAGMAVDVKLLDDLSAKAHKTIEKLNKQIWKEAGEEFNVASSVQLREVLFEKMKLPTKGIKKGKTGYSTASPELEKLREYSDIIPMIEEFREVSKLQNTYTDVLPKLVHKKTKRIHTSFNQTVAATGRLSSSDPNMQNIPVRTELGREIRNAFVAKKGYTLLAADYSQIELRIVASLADDKDMIAIFEKGEDIHKATAAAINGVKLDEVTKKMRYAAKEVNFGVLYGMGAHGLAWRAGIPHWQAKEFIEKYFEAFSGVKKFLDKTLKFAEKNGYVETLFARRRYIPELISGNYQMRAAGERMAINMPVQGTAADLMKMAMIHVYEKVKDRDDVRMILQVHDELVLEVKEGKEDEVGKLVQKEMETVLKLDVPIVVEVHIAKRWGEVK